MVIHAKTWVEKVQALNMWIWTCVKGTWVWSKHIKQKWWKTSMFNRLSVLKFGNWSMSDENLSEVANEQRRWKQTNLTCDILHYWAYILPFSVCNVIFYQYLARLCFSSVRCCSLLQVSCLSPRQHIFLQDALCSSIRASSWLRFRSAWSVSGWLENKTPSISV